MALPLRLRLPRVLACAGGQCRDLGQASRSVLAQAFLRKRSEAVLLVLDRAGWHIGNATQAHDAEGGLKYLPSHSPELQPVERLWLLTDEPLANEVFEPLSDLEAVLAERCVSLTSQRERIRSLMLYHWWPGGADQTTSD